MIRNGAGEVFQVDGNVGTSDYKRASNLILTVVSFQNDDFGQNSGILLIDDNDSSHPKKLALISKKWS